MKLLGDRILVKPVLTPVRIGSIYVPNQKLTYEAVVKYVGDELTNTLKEGDRVLFDKHAGYEVTIDEEKLIMLVKDDLMAVVE